MLNVDITVVCLHLRSRFLGSVADFSNAEARAATAAERAPSLPARQAMRYERLSCV